MRPLAPGFQQVQQARRGLSEQGVGIGAGVAQHLGRRLVDQSDPISRVDYQQAFAQVLNDVLGKLRHVGKVDLPAPDQGFAFAQAVGDGPRQKGHAEEHQSDEACCRVVGRGRSIRESNEDLLHENGQRCDGRNEQSVEVIREHGHRQDRQHEQDSQATAHTAARVQNDGDTYGVDARIHQRDDSQAGPVQPAGDDQQNGSGEVADTGRGIESRLERTGRPLRTPEPL